MYHTGFKVGSLGGYGPGLDFRVELQSSKREQ